MSIQINNETILLEIFSDGVFAIVITLLALELNVPHDTFAENLKEVLLDRWPVYISFFTSFFTILIIWFNHHTIFKFIRMADSSFIYVNSIMLCLVTIVPFTTSLVARYFNTSSSSLVLMIYCGLFVLINISFNWLWYVVRKHKNIMKPAVDIKEVNQLTISYLVGFPAYLAALAMAVFYPAISLLLCFILLVSWALLVNKLKVPE